MALDDGRTGCLESNYNLALLSYNDGEVQDAYNFAKSAQKIFPDHNETKTLMDQINCILHS